MSCNSDEKNIARHEEETEPVVEDTDAPDETLELEFSTLRRNNTPDSSHADADDLYEISSSSSSIDEYTPRPRRPIATDNSNRESMSFTMDDVSDPSSRGEVVACDVSISSSVHDSDTAAMDSDPGPTSMMRLDKDDVDVSQSNSSCSRGSSSNRHGITGSTHAWRDKIRSMVVKARDGGLIILQRVKESENSTASKGFDENDFGDSSVNSSTRSTTRSARQSRRSNRSSTEVGIPLGETSERTVPPPDADSMSINSSTSFGSWNVSWPRPGAYFVRYMRRHPGDHPSNPISTRQRRDGNMSSHSRTTFATFTTEAFSFPFAVPVLDDEDVTVVRVQGIEYGHQAAARLTKRRRRRCLVMVSLLSTMLLAFAAVGALVVVYARRAQLFASSDRPSFPLQGRTHAPSASPTPYRASVTIEPYLQRFAKAVGNVLVFHNGTSHRLAANWIFYSDPLQLPVHNEHLVQRFLMALFYFQMSNNGESAWRFCNPPEKGMVDSCQSLVENMPLAVNDDAMGLQYFRWMSGKHECNWMGASCDNNNVIWGLQLNGQNLTGTLPTEIALITSLQSLSLSSNFIKGTIPDNFPRLKNLVLFNLEGNKLTGSLSDAWYHATVLRSFNIGNNRFRGNISAKLGLLSNLTELLLHDNDLTGTIPTELGELSRMSYMKLSGNSFVETVPTELGQLSLLKKLWLSRNKLVGTLPSELGLLTAMTDLRLGHNVINGTIPEELYNLTNLQLRLELQSMNLTGTLSTKLGRLTKLQSLFLGRNRLHGTVPTQLGYLKYLGLASFGLNLFTGPIPNQICKKTINVQADCGPTVDPSQECSCCQSCCDRSAGNCTSNRIFNL